MGLPQEAEPKLCMQEPCKGSIPNTTWDPHRESVFIHHPPPQNLGGSRHPQCRQVSRYPGPGTPHHQARPGLADFQHIPGRLPGRQEAALSLASRAGQCLLLPTAAQSQAPHPAPGSRRKARAPAWRGPCKGFGHPLGRVCACLAAGTAWPGPQMCNWALGFHRIFAGWMHFHSWGGLEHFSGSCCNTPAPSVSPLDPPPAGQLRGAPGDKGPRLPNILLPGLDLQLARTVTPALRHCQGLQLPQLGAL